MDRYRLSIAYFAPQTLYLRTTETGSQLKARSLQPQILHYNITKGTREVGIMDLRDCGIIESRNYGFTE